MQQNSFILSLTFSSWSIWTHRKGLFWPILGAACMWACMQLGSPCLRRSLSLSVRATPSNTDYSWNCVVMVTVWKSGNNSGATVGKTCRDRERDGMDQEHRTCFGCHVWVVFCSFSFIVLLSELLRNVYFSISFLCILVSLKKELWALGQTLPLENNPTNARSCYC